VILVAGSEREDRMAVPRAYFDDAGVEAELLGLPVIGIGKSVKRGNNDSARNVAAVLLADDIVIYTSNASVNPKSLPPHPGETRCRTTQHENRIDPVPSPGN
jgi:hypothetical protein